MKTFAGRRVFSFLLLLVVVWSLSSCQLPDQSAEGTVEPTGLLPTQTSAMRPTHTRTPKPSQTSRITTTGSATPPTQLAVATVSGFTPTFSEGCDRAAPGVPIDISIPDDTAMQSGQAFTKVWRLKNIGECKWTRDYSVQFFSGERMGAPKSVPVSKVVDPGESVEISVDMIAPSVGGKYQGNWKLRNPSGQWFGIGPSGDAAFWVRIVVVPPPTPTPTPVTATPTASPTPPVLTSGSFTLLAGDHFDLDQDQFNNGEGEDLSYEVGENGQHHLAPLNGAALAVFGKERPTITDCQDAKTGARPLTVEKIGEGTYLCVHTNLGLPAWVLIKNLDSADDSLRMDTLTWSLP